MQIGSIFATVSVLLMIFGLPMCSETKRMSYLDKDRIFVKILNRNWFPFLMKIQYFLSYIKESQTHLSSDISIIKSPTRLPQS